MTSVPVTARYLGAAGVLPFLFGAAVAVCADDGLATLARSALAAYALAITCFLCGAWWGIALIRRAPFLLLASNAVVVVAWVSFTFLDVSPGLAALGALLVFTAVLECQHRVFSPQPAYYRRLRLRLTVLAAISLLAAAWLG